MSLEPITREEHFMARAAGNPGLDLEPITRTEYFLKDIADSGGGGGSVTPESIVTATGQMTEAQADRTRANIGAAQDSLKLTATPTSGPSGNTLMSGTWSGATWEEVVAAVLATRLIQVDVTTIGTITLLYNMGSATNASSNAFVYSVGGTLYSVFAQLFIVDGNNRFYLSIINAGNKTENVSGTTPTITPAANTTYNCGELTSLTISNPPATGAYSIVFTSGSTATTTTIPATILGLEDFAADANTMYEINVLDNRAVVGSWGVSA